MTICCLFLSAVLVAAPIPKERAEAEKIVGVWKLVRSSNHPEGLSVDLTLELHASGRLVIRQTSPGAGMSVYEGEYKVLKNEMPYSVKLPGGGLKQETLTIRKLTESELHVVDPDGIEEDFIRVRPDNKTNGK